MHVIKPSSLGLAFRPMEYRKRFGLCVSGYLYVPFAQPPGGTLWGEQSMWNFLSEEMGQPQIDEGISKLTSEFLVHGYAYPDARQPGSGAVAVRARLGATEKILLAFGDRHWDGDRITPPAPFDRIALNWTNAYGGPGYARNPLGKGRASVDGLKSLPNIESPEARLTGRRQEVAPASFAALDPMHPQRAALRGTYDERWLEEHSPGFAPDLNWKHFNVAPNDQWMSSRLEGDEPYALENLHPTRSLIEGRLPGLRVRAFTRMTPLAGIQDGKLREVAMRLSTVWFFPHAERMVLVFHGLAECTEDDAGDIDLLLGAVERTGGSQQKEDAHYLEAIRKRTRAADSDLHSLIQSDLLPSRLDTVDPSLEAIAAAMRPTGLKEEAAYRRAQLDMEFARGRARARGIDPDAIGLRLPPRERAPTLDELPEILIAKRQETVNSQWVLVDKLLRGHQQRMEQIGAGQLDPAKLVPRGPPLMTAAATLAALERTHAEANEPLDRPDMKAKLESADLARRIQYLQAAHVQEPALAQADPQRRRVREEVEWMLARRFTSWKGFDFTGADLSNLDLRGVDLSGAWLESANFENSNLSRANLSASVLAHANLRGCVAVGANFEGANLGGANLERVLMDRALLGQAILSGTRMANAEMRGVQMGAANLLDSVWEQADWAQASLVDLVFHKLDLRGCSFARAQLTACLFIECDLRGVDFTGARMAGTSFSSCRALGAVFSHSDLTGAVFASATDLEKADFRAANLQRVNFGDARLAHARLNGAVLEDACLAGVDMSEADLGAVRAGRALFRKAVLRRCNLAGADLIDAILQRADLRGADLTGANLFGADLSRVRLDADVRLDRAVLERARIHPRLTPAQHQG